MPFVSRRDIALKVRTQAEKVHRKQLREALSNPVLTVEQRHHIREKLDQVGQSRVYSADKPPPPGAIQMPQPSRYSTNFLEGQKKTELVALAREEGVPVSGTKADLIERLISI